VNLIYYHRVSFKHQNPYARVSYQLGEQKGTNKALFDYKFQKNTATTSSIDTGIGGFVDSRSENLDVNYELDLNRVGLSLGYSGDFTLYEGDYKSTNTYRDQYGSIGGFFRFPSMPRTRFFIEYDHGKNTYYKSATTSDDCRYNKYWVGIEDRITPRIFGVAKFGYQDRDYKGSKDRTSTITKVRLEYRYSSLTKFLLNVYTGGIDSPYRSDGYTVQDLVGLEFYHRFSSNRKLSCMTGLEYQVNTYVTPKKENTTRFRLGLDYAFRKWFNLGFKYKYEKKDSNIDHLDYKTGVYTLEAKAVF
jgi:hypothetical protein